MAKGANISERAASCGCRRCRETGGEAAASEAPTAVVPPSAEDSRLARLERLGELHEKGILTDEEFAAEKSRVLRDDSGSYFKPASGIETGNLRFTRAVLYQLSYVCAETNIDRVPMVSRGLAR